MKSRVSGYLPFVEALLFDATHMSQASIVEAQRDFVTITNRCEHEGMSFLTITLPAFCSAFDKALASGKVDLSAFPSWRSQKCLPSFLRGFTSRVFDPYTGGLLDEPDIQSIKAVRQICLCFKKLGLQCSRKRERAAICRYIETERFLHSFVPSQSDCDLFSKVADLLWGNMLVDFDHHQICPRHGPGAVVEKLTQNSKYANRRWHERLEPYFPSDAYVFANAEHWVEEGETLDVIPAELEEPVKVTLVPKTLKTPRIIAIEPCCQQYAQQGLARELISRLERFWLTKGHVNFKDQSINQDLAMKASLDGLTATLDMSDASDRISLSLVQRMLRTVPDFLGALEACRSKAARLPDGRIIPLGKFASMGSAVCFPIEAMVFFTIAVAACLREQALPVTLRNIEIVSRRVYVYGDDIIVPTDMALAVSGLLCSLGNKVNLDKSFYEGLFRESCGVDAYGGKMVTPVYVRATWPRDRRCVSELISLVATGNQLFHAGYLRAARLLKLEVERVLGPLPQVRSTCSGLGWHYPSDVPRSYYRFNRAIQVLQVLTWIPEPVKRVDTLNGWSAMLKFFIRTECGHPASIFGPEDRVHLRLSMPEGLDAEHLTRTPRYGTARLKRRRVTPY